MDRDALGDGAPGEPDPFDRSSFSWWDDDDLHPSGPPLPPEDRLWRHPSEVGAMGWNPAPPGGALIDREPSRRQSVLLGLTALTAAGLTAAMFAVFGPVRERVVERTVERQAVEPLTIGASVLTGSTGFDVADVADAVRPAITKVKVLDANDEPYTSGSGVIFREDGHLLTNAHVVDGGHRLVVVLADGQEYDADLVGADDLTDIAVLRLQGSDTHPTAVLGSTERLRVGQPAIAIGSPLGLDGGPTVTLGVVSAKGRTLQRDGGVRQLYDLVQTDAPIAPGSSGGALVDAGGSVIGITTVIAVSDVGAEGLGFAVPIEIAHDVALDLLTGGEARHGYLGVEGFDLAADTAAELGLEGGVVIQGVRSGTPADDGGLLANDVITHINGRSIVSMGSLVVTVRRHEPGERVDLTVVRNGTPLIVSVVIAQRS